MAAGYRLWSQNAVMKSTVFGDLRVLFALASRESANCPSEPVRMAFERLFRPRPISKLHTSSDAFKTPVVVVRMA